jgi:3-oxoadipate enol-lactonase
MAQVTLGSPHQGLVVAYEDDFLGEPWKQPVEPVVLIHGVAESGQAWFAWVPGLATRLRVLRLDLPGFGKSQPLSQEFALDAPTLAGVVRGFLDALDVESAHVIGAKYGGAIAVALAETHPEVVRSLVIISSPMHSQQSGGAISMHSMRNRLAEIGVKAWAGETQRARLGSHVSQEQVDWWTEFMSSSDQASCVRATASAEKLDLRQSLSGISVPTLVITADKSPLLSVDVVRSWQQQIPRSTLAVLEDDGFHLAASHPVECIEHVLRFYSDNGLIQPG